MSQILIPFIDHTAMNHKNFIRRLLPNNQSDSTCFWSGIYPEYSSNINTICANFADKLLCYDKCVITIEDYLFLTNAIGLRSIDSLQKEGALEIFDNMGAKTSIFKLSADEPYALTFNYSKNYDLEKTVFEYQSLYHVTFNAETIRHILSSLTKVRQPDFNDAWFRELNDETINDLHNQRIINNLGLINDGKIIDRDHDYNQILYNRIAYMNLYMAQGNSLSIGNVLLPPEIQVLLNSKIGAYLNCGLHEEYDAYSSIMEYSGLTDVSRLIQDGLLSFNDIVKIRNNNHSRDFRIWLELISHNHSLASISEITDYVQLYNDAIHTGANISINRDNNTTRTMKFVIPLAMGFILPEPYAQVISVMISASLFIKEMIENNYRPNIFIENCLGHEIGIKMNEKMIRDENAYYVHLNGKIQRNSPCPCHSGKKYKDCHGKS